MILINYTCFLINIHLIIKNETRKKRVKTENTALVSDGFISLL